jgi:drug/metabolite transporter (DMT)-like permease
MLMPDKRGKWKSSATLALVALVGITAVWGATFLIVQNAVARMPVMDFLALRFTAAALIMFVLRPGCLRGVTFPELRRATALGVALGLGYIAQTYGLLYAPVSVSGFITGTFVVLTPVVSLVLLRRKTSPIVWLAVALATIGLALLSLHGWSVGFGELLTLVCALFFAIHIVGLGEWSSQYETYGFTLLQIATVAVISLVMTLPDGLTVPPDTGVWLAVTVTAVLATALAFLVQTWAQALVPPTRVAVVMTMEPVFAGLFATVIGGNPLTLRIIGGAACVLAATYFLRLRSLPGLSGLRAKSSPVAVSTRSLRAAG